MFNIKEVHTPHDEKLFLEMPLSIYKNDKNWIRPLDNDIKQIFASATNKLLKDGKVARWLLLNTENIIVGRVAAFVNKRTMYSDDMLVGGMGFFECINNQDAANTLFDTCRNWLEAEGMQAMEGPINFGERNQWWGCLFEGFSAPTYQMNYNPLYYTSLFENYGFQVYFDQLVYRYRVNQPITEKFQEKWVKLQSKKALTFRHISKKNLTVHAKELAHVYNEAWAKMGHFKPITDEQALASFHKMKPIMEEKLIWFGYYDNEPIAFLVMLPEINQIIRYLNGQMNWWSKLLFAWHLYTGTCRNIFGVLFGVIPRFQGKGIEGALIVEAANTVQHLNYNDIELNWIGDFNPKMVHMVESFGATVTKRYHTYRKNFDPNRPFRKASTVL